MSGDNGLSQKGCGTHPAVADEVSPPPSFSLCGCIGGDRGGGSGISLSSYTADVAKGVTSEGRRVACDVLV